jgi:hypothetical protein
MEHSRYEPGMYWADMFYKSGGLNPNYDRDVELYKEWLAECWRLMKRAACAANWFGDVVRRDINPMFFAERGKFVVLEGMFEDLSYHASIPEFTEDEKNGLPESLAPKTA